MTRTHRPLAARLRNSVPLIGLLVFAVSLMVIWELSVCTPDSSNACDGRLYALLSKPSDVWLQFWNGDVDHARLWSLSWNTTYSAGLGLLMTFLAGALWYILAGRFPAVRNFGYTVVWLFQVVPYVAFAWVFSLLFGGFDKALFGCVVASFPLVGSLLAGLNKIEPYDVELMNLYKASFWMRFRHLYFPKGIHSLFSGMYLAAPLSVVGAMLADLSGGENAGLGKQIFLAARNARPAELWVSTLAAVIVSLFFSLFVWLAERAFMVKNRWYRKGVIDDNLLP